MENVAVLSNWISNCQISQVITCCPIDSEECDIDGLSAATCVCLTKPENLTENFKAEIEIISKCLMKKLILFSEASTIEVFGAHNEYLFTCESDFVDDWEGMAVYHGRILLPGISKCKLKFSRTKDQSRVWIYRIQITVLHSNETSRRSVFNFQNVNSLISSSSQQISENAEKFKNFLENYLSEEGKKTSFSSNEFLGLLHKEYVLEDLGISKCKNLEHRKDTQSQTTENNSDLELRGKLNNDESDGIKEYIDVKMEKIKEEIIVYLDVKFNEFRRENNEKLDEIIKMLQHLNYDLSSIKK